MTARRDENAVTWDESAARRGSVKYPIRLDAVPTVIGTDEHAEPWEGHYFVAAYPPFSAWKREQAPNVLESLRTAPRPAGGVPLGVYVHVPFCAKRCEYCYYLSSSDASAKRQTAYVEAVLEEARLYADFALLAERKPDFVYFGGGTPSVLTEPLMERLIHGLQASFPWRQAREVTFECAPKSTTASKVQLLRDLGITRISLGVQSFDDDVLHASGRVHMRDDAERAFATIRAAGFDAVNVDLMVGLPGETDATVASSVARAIELGCDSVTVYQFEIPYHTPLHRRVREAALHQAIPSWEVKRARLRSAFVRLEGAGYIVRSAYTAVRKATHRAFVYQDEQYRGADLLGLGASAFSFLAGVHFQNLAAPDAYLASVGAGQLPIDRAYALNADEKLVREFVLQLKLGKANADYFRAKFGREITERFREPLQRFTERGWLSIHPRGVTVTREGLLRIDRLLPAFYLPEHRNIPYC